MSYLAEVEMPEREEPELEVREEIEISELDDEDEGVEEEQSPLPPPPKKKDKLKSEDIFKPKQAPPKKVKTDAPSLRQEETISEDPIIPQIAPVKEKKKRKMSEKQLEALKRGREKRMAQKKQNPTPTPQPTPTFPMPEPAPAPVANQQYFTADQVQKMIYAGVSQYDTERKKRKEMKYKQKARDAHDSKVFNDINSALNRTNDPWASAFNFS